MTTVQGQPGQQAGPWVLVMILHGAFSFYLKEMLRVPPHQAPLSEEHPLICPLNTLLATTRDGSPATVKVCATSKPPFLSPASQASCFPPECAQHHQCLHFVQPTRLFLLKNHLHYGGSHVAHTGLPSAPPALLASDSVTPILAGGTGGGI